MRATGGVGIVLLIVLLSACGVALPASSGALVPTLAPSVTPSVLPTSTATATPVPSATPTATPAPTVDPAVIDKVIAEGATASQQHGIEPLCLQYADADGDGAAEWLGLYVKPSQPQRIGAFVVGNDGTWHELSALDTSRYGLGEYAECEIAVRDINADQKPEVLVWGHAAASTTLLHIYAWDGTAYRLLAPFEGDAGVRLEDLDGQPGEEVVVSYHRATDLLWEVIYTWDGQNYAWTWDRYGWYYLDRPHAYAAHTPELVVISHYLAINDRDLPGAYRLFSGAAQANQSYDTWCVGYGTTLAIEAGQLHETSRDGDSSAVVTLQVRAYENAQGQVVGRLWHVAWTVTRAGDEWRLESGQAELLDEWEAPYYQ